MRKLRDLRTTASIAVVLFVVQWTLDGGCSPQGAAPKQGTDASEHGAPFGQICSRNSDCASSLCVLAKMQSSESVTEGFCSAKCKSDADCVKARQSVDMTEPPVEPLVCGIGPDNKRVCAPACTQSPVVASFVPPFSCQAGIPTACDVAPDSACDRCGCPKAKRCDSELGCVDLSDLDGKCRVDADCRSNNCSTYAGRCRVALGQPCSIENCDRCMTQGSWSYCSRDCTGGYACGGGVCMNDPAYPDLPIFACTPACGPACPGSCMPAIDGIGGRVMYCACPTCASASAPHGLGEACHRDRDCSSSECYAPNVCSGSCGGSCSQACASSAECGDAVCADVPCAGSQPDPRRCGKRCVPKCPASGFCATGVCRELQTTEGDAAIVCDTHLGKGAKCNQDSDCQSWSCVGNKCAPEGGADNGAPCAQATDCKSGTCSNSVCRGSSLLGDSCASDLDCAVGRCCSGMCC